MIYEMCIYIYLINIFKIYFAAPGPVDNVQAQSSFDIINVTFSPPIEPNGVIRRYQVEYTFKKHDQCVDENEKTNESMSVTKEASDLLSDGQLTIELTENIYPYWDYVIRVRAATVPGYGNWSSEYRTRTMSTSKVQA